MWSRKNPRILRNVKIVTLAIHRVWNVKTEVKPVIIGVTETISKSFIKYPTKMPGKYEIKRTAKKKKQLWALTKYSK